MMAPPSAVAAVAIEAPHAPDVMATDRNCSDQLTSSSERLHSLGLYAVLAVDASPLLSIQTSIGFSPQSSFPQKLGLPLYTLLSTFRI